MNNSNKTAPTSTTAERYFADLETRILGADGKLHHRTQKSFIRILRSLHASYRPKYDLGACTAGANGFQGNVWFWSDLHLSHANIIKFCDRPFNSVEHMNSVLLQNCVSRVQADDILVFGGDLMMKDLDSANAVLRAMPGFKILVAGNHDCDGEKLLSLAVDEIAPCLEIDFQGRTVFISHYPISEELLSLRQVNLHGHLHDNQLPAALGTGAKHFSMCVEYTAYAPMLLADLLREK